ncbi:Ig-like domain repeat protein [Candidatus Protochlamydia amoebophila]|uniref:Ig-like domain repeat protein n=1 Tax=Candidatus Protochlamydia amoebophila TaxID=362787 RepID=UPI000035309B|nr:Ig-like domain repeat protein [Candidatus Protochlamydia amoebophila]
MRLIKIFLLFSFFFSIFHLFGNNDFIAAKTFTSVTSCRQPDLIAYLTAEKSNEIIPINLSNGREGVPIIIEPATKILAMHAATNEVYFVEEDLKQIKCFHLKTKMVREVGSLNQVPAKFIVPADKKVAYLSYEDSNDIDCLNLLNGQLTKVVNLKINPSSIAFDSKNQRLYVSLKNQNEIKSIHLASLETTSFALLDHNIESLTITNDGQKIYALQENNHQLSIVDAQTQAITHISLKNDSGILQKKTNSFVLHPNENHIYILKESADQIIPVNLLTGALEPLISVRQSIQNINFDDKQGIVARFSVKEAKSGLPTVFDASETILIHSGEVSYEWEFGDGLKAVSSQPIIEHVYDNTGHFTATLTITQKVENDFIAPYLEYLMGNPFLTSSTKKSFDILSSKNEGLEKISKKQQAAKNTADSDFVAEPSITHGQPSQTTIFYGHTVFDSATVTGSFTGGTPTGTVTFFVESTQVGSPIALLAGLNNTAVAVSDPYYPTSTGNYQFKAVYSGDSNYEPSSDSSATNTFIVNPAPSITNLTTNINPSYFGETVQLTATVTLSNTQINETPTGTITFKDNNTVLGIVTLTSSSTANLSISDLGVGTHSLTAIYSGDAKFAGSTSSLVTQTVTKGTTMTVLTSSINPTIFGNSTTLTATVNINDGSGTLTGAVTFKDGSTIIGTGNVNAGIATLNVSNLSVGSHSLTAVYGGDSNFNTSTSTALTQIVNKGTTTSNIVSLTNPTTYGQPTILTASIAVATGVGTPTGYFTFKDGNSTLGTANITGSNASLTIANLAVGAHSITAVYSGDLNFSTSTSSVISQQVNRATPVISLTSTLNPSNYAEEITFTASISSPTTLDLPSGTITFYDGNTSIGTGTLVQTGANKSQATFTTPNLNGGNHSITASYPGDTNFIAVTSSTLDQTVILANTNTLIFSNSPNASQFGQPITLQANVIGSVATPPLTSSGTLSFYDGSTLLGAAPITKLSSNVAFATLTLSNLSIGPHTLSAKYSGDVNYNPSNSSSMTQTIIFTATTITTVTSHTPSVFGELIKFTATVNSHIPGMGNPTGKVEFYDGINLIGSGTLAASGANQSQATLQISSLGLGTHRIGSAYLGDGDFTGSLAPLINQIVVKDTTTTTLASNLNPSNFGDEITLSATVTANAPGSGISTGTVTFKEGSKVLGTGTLNANGVATFSTIKLYPGNHSLTATFNGDFNFISSTSNTFKQTVINQLPTKIKLTSFRNSSPINQTVTFSAEVTALTGIPTGTVTFYDNGVAFGTGTINANGIATCIEPANRLNTLGLHPITASYSGDINFITSNSSTYNQYVVPYDTSTVLVTLPNHSEQANATLTATITATGSPMPIPSFTGTVVFYEGGNAISPPIPVDPLTGIASFMPDNLHFGPHPISAVYSGDQIIFATSTSNSIVQQVQQTDMLTTKTVLTASPNPSYFCEMVELTAAVVATQGYYTPTGTITFFNGEIAIGTSILDANGIAVLPISNLSVGTHQLTATYNSDSNYAFSISNTITQQVNPNTTLTTLSVIPNLSSTPYGQTLTFVATVDGLDGLPTGSVIFSDQSGELATIELDESGEAVFTTDSLPTGTHDFTAIYDPSCCSVKNPCYSPSSATLSHTITAVDLDTILTASPSPSIYGNTIALTATVDSFTTGSPTGTVTFYNGSTLIGTAPIIQGTARIDANNVQAGVAIFNARYNGDINFIAKNFPSRQQIVNKAPVNVALTSFTNPSLYGQLVTFNASVSSAGLISVPTGTITFLSGTTNLGQATLNNGVATFSTSILNVGSNSITALYSGSSNFLTATSSALTQVVNKSATTTTVDFSPFNASTFNSSVTVNVTVASVSPGGGIPTGAVTGYYGSVSLGTATLNNGIASFSTTILPTGTPTVTVIYAGDAKFTESQGLATHTVTAAMTTMATLTSSNNPSVFGQSLTLSGKVNSTAGIPTGQVTFYDGTTELGVATLDSTGRAAITRTNLNVGSHSITLKYLGSGNFAASTSAALNQVVNKTPTTTVVSSSQSISIYGEPIDFIATVGPINPGSGIPTGTVTFKNGSTILGTVSLNGGGIASFATPMLSANNTPYSITAVYNGDANFNSSISSILEQTILQVSTRTTATSSPNPSTIGNLVTINVTVEPINTDVFTPTGIVTATYGSTVIGTGTLDSTGKITFLTTTLPAGTLPIVIKYAGDSNHAQSSMTLSQTVLQASTVTSLTSSLNSSHVGETITLTATLTSPFGTPTGNVAFFDGSSLIGVQALNGAGVAIFSTSSLTLGTHQIKALYQGDANFTASTSPVLSQNIIAATTSIALSSSMIPSVFGQTITLTADVTILAGSGVVSGTVTFNEGSVVLGTSGVSNGIALITISNLSVGAHTLKATYNGNSSFGNSTSPNLNQIVEPGTTKTFLSSSSNPSQFGDVITLTANVSTTGGNGTLTGTVTFKNGSSVLGTGTISNDQATFSVSDLGVGTHTLTAVYSGNTNFEGSTSSNLKQIVNKSSSLITLTSSINPSEFSQTDTLIATIPAGTASVTPRGTVTFKDGSLMLGTVNISEGRATLNMSNLTVGSHDLTATYNGDGNFAASTSALLTQIVKAAATTVLLNSSTNPSVFGNSINFSATVAPMLGTGTPTGTVIFRDGNVVLGNVTLVGGVANFTTSTLSVNTHAITAVYVGDGNFAASVSSPLSEQVNQGATATSLSTSASPSTYGQSVVFTANVSLITGSGSPSGSVTILDGTTVIGTATVDNLGVATLAVSNLSVNSHSLTAVYSGDSHFATSTSSILMQNVNKANSSIDILTTSPNPSRLGENVTLFATVTTPIGIASGNVSFYDNQSTLLGTVPVYNGLAIYSTNLLALGNHTIKAIYNGDANFNASTSPTVVQTVNQTNITVTTVTNLNSALNPSNFGQNIDFTITVAPITGSSTPTGIITLYFGSVPLTTLNLVNGQASYSTTTLPSGEITLVALYSGDASYSSSTDTLVQCVNKVGTNVKVVSSINPSAYKQPVTFTSTVTSGSETPTGTVTFYDGSIPLGTSALNEGMATLEVISLAPGSHSIIAAYNSDLNFATSTSQTLIQVVTRDTIPQPPQNFYGCQIVNQFVDKDHLVNVLYWIPPQENANIVFYEIYRDAQLKRCIGKIPNQCPFQFEDGNRKKNKAYTYYIVSVNKKGVKSAPISTKVFPIKKRR